jgi:hypothetical protein
VTDKTPGELVRDASPESFTSHQILDRTPWIFATHREYIEWKTRLATGISVDPFSIIVVGSACTGFSLNPSKDFSRFHAGSDVDVAIVSPRHFDEAWRWLRSLGPLDALPAGSFERDMFAWHRRNLVFDGTIATDRLLDRLPFGPTWASALARSGKGMPINGRAVKARIYRDYESLRAYHVKNVSNLRAGLLSGSDDAPAPLKVLDA